MSLRPPKPRVAHDAPSLLPQAARPSALVPMKVRAAEPSTATAETIVDLITYQEHANDLEPEQPAAIQETISPFWTPEFAAEVGEYPFLQSDEYFALDNSFAGQGRPYLTEIGLERAYGAASNGRLNLKAEHVSALLELNANGGVQPVNHLSRKQYSILKDMDHRLPLGEDNDRAIAIAGLNNNHEEWERLQDRSYLLRFSPDGKTVAITSLGRELLETGKALERSMVEVKDHAILAARSAPLATPEIAEVGVASEKKTQPTSEELAREVARKIKQ